MLAPVGVGRSGGVGAVTDADSNSGTESRGYALSIDDNFDRMVTHSPENMTLQVAVADECSTSTFAKLKRFLSL